MDIPKLNNWLKNKTVPSGRLYNILSLILMDDDISPEEITKDGFLAVKGAGITMWHEFISIKKGTPYKAPQGKKKNRPKLPELHRGQLWIIDDELYELYDMRVTGAISPTNFITTAFLGVSQALRTILSLRKRSKRYSRNQRYIKSIWAGSRLQLMKGYLKREPFIPLEEATRKNGLIIPRCSTFF